MKITLPKPILRLCACGCGKTVKVGHFAKGHENRVQSAVVKQLQQLNEIIDFFGWRDERVFKWRLDSAEFHHKNKRESRRN